MGWGLLKIANRQRHEVLLAVLHRQEARGHELAAPRVRVAAVLAAVDELVAQSAAASGGGVAHRAAAVRAGQDARGVGGGAGRVAACPDGEGVVCVAEVRERHHLGDVVVQQQQPFKRLVPRLAAPLADVDDRVACVALQAAHGHVLAGRREAEQQRRGGVRRHHLRPAALHLREGRHLAVVVVPLAVRGGWRHVVGPHARARLLQQLGPVAGAGAHLHHLHAQVGHRAEGLRRGHRKRVQARHPVARRVAPGLQDGRRQRGRHAGAGACVPAAPPFLLLLLVAAAAALRIPAAVPGVARRPGGQRRGEAGAKEQRSAFC
mmetsp:Transcript_43858/g.110945  ORF Transcript_43858/g.110945 Transcript_43858/m.110945 type:complete len:320 (+) Transcript_43858:52-1011(+)